MVLPTLVLTLLGLAGLQTAQARSDAGRARLRLVRTARAKGLRENKAVMKHALRTALIPTGTYFAFQAATLFVGATYTERIFAFQGMGIYGVDTISTPEHQRRSSAVTAFGVHVLPDGVPSSPTSCAVPRPARTAELRRTTMSIDFRTSEEPEALDGHAAPNADLQASHRGQLIRRRFLFRTGTAIVGLAIIGVLVLLALVRASTCSLAVRPARTSARHYKPPSAQHLFGTTQAGFDVMSRTVPGLGQVAADHRLSWSRS